MSWDSEEQLTNAIFQGFSFFKSDGGDGVISESIALSKRFKIGEIRVHFSVAFASTEYLVARISSIKGSAHDIILISYNCSGSTDVTLYYSTPMMFLSDDQLVVELSNTSGVNVIGLNVIGWAVIGT